MSGRVDILDHFITQARDVHLGNSDGIDLSPRDLAELISNDVLRTRFALRFQTEAQDPELRALILVYLKGLAAKEEETGEIAKIDADGVDSYVGRVGIGATAAAVGFIVTTGGVGGFILLAGGLVALGVSGITSNTLRKQAAKRGAFAKRIRELIEELDGDD